MLMAVCPTAPFVVVVFLVLAISCILAMMMTEEKEEKIVIFYPFNFVARQIESLFNIVWPHIGYEQAQATTIGFILALLGVLRYRDWL